MWYELIPPQHYIGEWSDIFANSGFSQFVLGKNLGLKQIAILLKHWD